VSVKKIVIEAAIVSERAFIRSATSSSRTAARCLRRMPRGSSGSRAFQGLPGGEWGVARIESGAFAQGSVVASREIEVGQDVRFGLLRSPVIRSLGATQRWGSCLRHRSRSFAKTGA